MRHHSRTGTSADPDRSLHEGFPVTGRSLARKLLRDISGLTGLKTAVGLALMDAEVLQWTVANDVTRLPQQGRRWHSYPLALLRNASGMLMTNALLFGALHALGHGWVYWTWVAGFFTFFPLFVRIRSIAEHGCVPRVQDMLQNTRTTRAGLLARLTVAPNRVNFHIEHHLAPGIPYFRLKQAHRILRERDLVPAPPSYLQVLRIASTPATDASDAAMAR
jgi:fatty acid desaturase